MAFGSFESRPVGGAADSGDFNSKLYVANLPRDIEEEEIRKVFSVYGVVDDVHVNRPTEGRQDRSAFVRFEDSSSAIAAMIVLTDMFKFREDSPAAIFIHHARPQRDGKGGDRRTIVGGGDGGSMIGGAIPALPPPPPLGGSTPPPPAAPKGGGSRDAVGKLWVGSLPSDITDDQLRLVFGNYGSVVEVNILPSKSKSGQRCAFVNFATNPEADAALRALGQGYEFKVGEGEIKVERPSDRPMGPKGGGYGGYGAAKGGKGGGYGGGYGRPY